MVIDSPPERQAQPGDADAEALFEEAREVARRRRRRRLAGASAVAAIALAAGIGFGVSGGGGGPGLARHGAGSAGLAASSSHQQQSFTGTIVGTASVCSLASRPAPAGDPPAGQCVIILPDGHRYQCPVAVATGFNGDEEQAVTSSACHRVAPPPIPASWRPEIRQMDRAEVCMKRAGLVVGGSAMPLGALRGYPDSPVAALLITGVGIAGSPAAAALRITGAGEHGSPGPRPTAMSFYLTAARARQAYARTLPTITRQGQSVSLRGRVLYTYQQAGEATIERGCLG